MTLYDVPVSNHGARNRYIIKKKGLEDDILIASPQAIGGLKSPEYLALNPQGKMPLLILEDGTPLPESEVGPRPLLLLVLELGRLYRQDSPVVP